MLAISLNTMEMVMHRYSRWLACLGLLALAAAAGGCLDAAKDSDQAKAAPKGDFANQTIDFGVVVSDIDKSVAFYTKAVGFKQVGAFSVSGSMGKDSGLTDGTPVDIKVLSLGEGAGATKLKLMQFKGVKAKASDEKYIHSTLGYSYITIFVKDTKAAVARAKAAGAKPLAKGPVALPENLKAGFYLTLLRDPDGNFVELVGP